MVSDEEFLEHGVERHGFAQFSADSDSKNLN